MYPWVSLSLLLDKLSEEELTSARLPSDLRRAGGVTCFCGRGLACCCGVGGCEDSCEGVAALSDILGK